LGFPYASRMFSGRCAYYPYPAVSGEQEPATKPKVHYKGHSGGERTWADPPRSPPQTQTDSAWIRSLASP